MSKLNKYLIRRRNKLNKVFRAPYRKGVNYLKIMDEIKEIANLLFALSFAKATK